MAPRCRSAPPPSPRAAATPSIPAVIRSPERPAGRGSPPAAERTRTAPACSPGQSVLPSRRAPASAGCPGCAPRPTARARPLPVEVGTPPGACIRDVDRSVRREGEVPQHVRSIAGRAAPHHPAGAPSGASPAPRACVPRPALRLGSGGDVSSRRFRVECQGQRPGALRSRMRPALQLPSLHRRTSPVRGLETNTAPLPGRAPGPPPARARAAARQLAGLPVPGRASWRARSQASPPRVGLQRVQVRIRPRVHRQPGRARLRPNASSRAPGAPRRRPGCSRGPAARAPRAGLRRRGPAPSSHRPERAANVRCASRRRGASCGRRLAAIRREQGQGEQERRIAAEFSHPPRSA